MGYFVVEGPVRLTGSVEVSGAKNASLPILAASIISEGSVELRNVPDLMDVSTMLDILSSIGMGVERKGSTVRITPALSPNTSVPYEPVRKMRVSFNVLGPLAAKFGRARVALPGGCSIGVRPVDFHIEGLKKMGFELEMEGGFVEARLVKPRDTVITLPRPSVGATEHLMTTAAALEGVKLVIENAAMEPEIEDLQNFLRKLGVRVEGAGSWRIEIEGGVEKTDVVHEVIPDRIEAGTYAIALAATRGRGRIENMNPDHLTALWETLRSTGVDVKLGEDWVEVSMDGRPSPVHVNVMPYPGFPTDLQAQMMAYLSVASGTSFIKENVFPARFLHVDELKRMGADIEVSDGTAIITGVDRLSGAPVNGTDLRATAALVIAAFMAHGRSEIHHVEHIFRGYERVCEKFSKLGGKIEYVKVREYVE